MEAARYPERLSRPWPNPYVYPSLIKRVAARVLDFFGSLFFPDSSLPIPWHQLGRVAVLRLDHLGDLVHSFEALAAMRRAVNADLEEPERLREDPRLDPLRGDPRFAKLLEETGLQADP